MSWLNILTFINDGHRVYTEYQTYMQVLPGGFYPSYYRSRKVTVYNERYVGGNLVSATAKADELLAQSAYVEATVVPLTGGQHHVIAVRKVLGAWSAWEAGTPPET